MYLTICQACHRVRKLSANNGQKISFFKTIQKRFQFDSTSEKIRPHSENILITFSLQSPISEIIITLDLSQNQSFTIQTYLQNYLPSAMILQNQYIPLQIN